MTAEEILALPVLGVAYRERIIYGRSVRVPVVPNVQAHFVGPFDILRARDGDGVWWAPVKTTEGWYRRRCL